MMGGLVLKLRAEERVLVNGAVLEAVARPARLRVLTTDADILRLRDAVHPARADTPVRRLCHVVQMAVAGAAGTDAALREARPMIDALRGVFDRPRDRDALDAAEHLLAGRRAYAALRALRPLLAREAELMGRA